MVRAGGFWSSSSRAALSDAALKQEEADRSKRPAMAKVSSKPARGS